MIVDEPSSVTLSVLAAVEPSVPRAMSLTEFALVDDTFQVAKPAAPPDPALMNKAAGWLVMVPPMVLVTAFAFTLMASPPANEPRRKKHRNDTCHGVRRDIRDVQIEAVGGGRGVDASTGNAHLQIFRH